MHEMNQFYEALKYDRDPLRSHPGTAGVEVGGRDIPEKVPFRKEVDQSMKSWTEPDLQFQDPKVSTLEGRLN